MESTKTFALKLFLLTLANLVALGCLIVAFLLGVEQDNFVAASFPAFLALVLFISQPWLLVLYVAECTLCFLVCLNVEGAIVAFLPLPAFLSALITSKVYTKLYERGKLDRLFRHSPRTLGIWSASVFFAVSLISYAGYKDFPAFHQSSPPFVAEDSPLARGLTSSRYHWVHSYPHRVVWEAHVPPAQMERLAKELLIERVKSGTISSDFWNATPYWWHKPAGAVEEYTEPHGSWIDGAVYDTQNQMLYVSGYYSDEED